MALAQDLVVAVFHLQAKSFFPFGSYSNSVAPLCFVGVEERGFQRINVL